MDVQWIEIAVERERERDGRKVASMRMQHCNFSLLTNGAGKVAFYRMFCHFLKCLKFPSPSTLFRRYFWEILRSFKMSFWRIRRLSILSCLFQYFKDRQKFNLLEFLVSYIIHNIHMYNFFNYLTPPTQLFSHLSVYYYIYIILHIYTSVLFNVFVTLPCPLPVQSILSVGAVFSFVLKTTTSCQKPTWCWS